MSTTLTAFEGQDKPLSHCHSLLGKYNSSLRFTSFEGHSLLPPLPHRSFASFCFAKRARQTLPSNVEINDLTADVRQLSVRIVIRHQAIERFQLLLTPFPILWICFHLLLVFCTVSFQYLNFFRCQCSRTFRFLFVVRHCLYLRICLRFFRIRILNSIDIFNLSQSAFAPPLSSNTPIVLTFPYPSFINAISQTSTILASLEGQGKPFRK